MQLKTANGYDFFEATSALQKEIRRGHEEEAMYWALELAERYDEYTWGRLMVIASEDVGLADPLVPMLITSLAQQYEWMKKKKGPTWRILLATAVLALCRAPKTRLSDSFMCAITHRRDTEGWRLKIPEYALDGHTQRGKAWTREEKVDFWQREGCLLTNPSKEVPDVYEAEAFAFRRKYGPVSRAPMGGEPEPKPTKRRRGRGQDEQTEL